MTQTLSTTPTCTTLDEVLRAAAARWPRRTALAGPGGQWTFQQLDDRVTAAAAALTAAGVRRGDRLALVMSAGTGALTAFAAAVRSGACVVPLDPALPAARLGFALHDADCGFAITRAEDRARVRDLATPECRILAPGDLEGPSVFAGGAAEAARPGDEDLAYAIYTSGSTGQPKAVTVGHRAAAGHAHAAAGYFGLAADDRVLQFASLSFDVAQEEIWPTWLTGATLVVKDAAMPDGFGLAAICREYGLTVLQLPTAYWRALLAVSDKLDSTDFATVRLVIIGGEAATIRDTERWRAGPLARAELVNAYGPTECVVTATAYRLAPGAPLPVTSGGLPIGAAFPGRSVHVFDPDGGTTAAGEVGELFVGGLLADGYLGRPELTAHRFVTRTVDGGARRLYRTGDLVRAGTDIEFVGRTDSQVKQRGYRIELEEVEAALRAGDVVAAAAALAPRPDGELILGAVVVGGAGTAQTDVARLLPAYMVPAVIVSVDAVPLTVTGKIDRAAVADLLREWLAAEPRPADEPSNEPAEDADPVFRVMRELWQEVLSVDRIGPDDDFFALGGDSLLVMRLTARARGRGLRLQPDKVLAAGTLRRVAALAVSTDAVSTDGSPRGDAPAAVVDELPLLPAQHRWLLDGRLPDVDHFVLNALLQVPAELSREAVLAAARALLDQHDVLRARFAMAEQPIRARLVEVAAEDAVTVIDLGDAGPAVIEQRLAECQRQLSLDNGPVFRLVHIVLGARPGRLLVLAHHLLLDGWSMALFVDDVDTALSSAISTGTATLPSPSAGPRAIADAFDRYVASDEARADARGWLDAPWARVSPLPQDAQGPGLLPSIRTVRTALPAADTRRLMFAMPRTAPRLGALLNAAILVSVAEWSGHDCLAIDVYGHGRDVPVGGLDLSRTIAYVQATYPVVGTVAGSGVDAVLSLATTDPAPARRFSFDALRFASPEPAERAELQALPHSPLRLNYRSQLDRLERRPANSVVADADEETGAHRSPRQNERYQLMFEGDIVDGELLVGVKYSTDHYRAETVRALTDRTAQLLARTARRLTS